MGEETASSPTTAITTTGCARTRALSTAESAATGSPTSPQEKGARRSTETTSSGPLHTPNSVTSPSPPPASTSTSAIPFSWEEHPGVPKATCSIKPPSLPPSNQQSDSAFSPTAKLLPPPPPLRPSRPSDLVLGRIRKRPGARGAGHADPFAVALVTCSRGATDNDDNSQLDEGETKGTGGATQCEKGAGAGAGVVPVQAPSAAATGKLVGYSWRRGSSWRWGAVVGDRFGMGSCMPASAATGAVMDSTVRVPRRSLPTPTTAVDGSSCAMPTRRAP